jgi:Tfp pilus assembly protein PilF
MTEQADDLGAEEMERLVAETRLELASSYLTEADYENARVAFESALQLAPGGNRAAEARRG